MGKLTTLLGGLAGGIALLEVPFEKTFLASLDPFLNIVGVISIVVFSAGLVYNALKDIFQR